ncbi:hypothetical protein BC827DRAFT_267088 [Russula dissimulans]|nr:hypothetical protein BC827DRAFT_267088 [Russula dissimulans]
MVMAVLPAVCMAALMVVLQTWATFQGPGSIIFIASERPYTRLVFLVTPHVTFLGYLLASILIGTSRPDSALSTNGLYCSFHLAAVWRYLTPLSCLVLLALTAALEGERRLIDRLSGADRVFSAIVVVHWYRRWRFMKKAFPLADKKAKVLVCFRVGFFSVYTVLSLAVSVTFQREGTPDVSYLTEAGLPLAAFIVFATQKDILEVWGIRRASSVGTTSPTSTPYQQQTNHIGSSSEESVLSDQENHHANP